MAARCSSSSSSQRRCGGTCISVSLGHRQNARLIAGVLFRTWCIATFRDGSGAPREESRRVATFLLPPQPPIRLNKSQEISNKPSSGKKQKDPLKAGLSFSPGLILFVQTFGDLLTFNLHIHVLAADGVFRADGAFVVLPAIPVKLLERGCRIAVLKLLVAEGAIGERLLASMLAWRHSGFSVHN